MRALPKAHPKKSLSDLQEETLGALNDLKMFREAIKGLLNRLSTSPASKPGMPADLPLQAISPRVLVVVYDPIIDHASGEKLSQRMNWNRVDDLAAGYIADIEECSGGLVRYNVVERIDLDKFPIKVDGFSYDADGFLAVMNRQAPPHDPDLADYEQIMADLHLIERVNNGDFDEVWLFGFPYAGFHESRMVGKGAFWCNAPPLVSADCPRRFVIMGFSYERGGGEMLENLGHRTEAIMTRVYRHRHGEADLWTRFTRYDKIAPGQAEVGLMHLAPNSLHDYDWGNPTFVPSRCDDWLNFPNLRGTVRLVNCAEWGNGDIRLHHKWWFSHLPKAAGATDGIANNWWRYIIDPNMV